MTINYVKQILATKKNHIPRKIRVKCLSDPGVPGVRSMGPDLSKSIHPRLFADLTDMTLADEDTNSILTDNANRAIQGNIASDSTWWENLQPMQVVPSGGQFCI